MEAEGHLLTVMAQHAQRSYAWHYRQHNDNTLDQATPGLRPMPGPRQRPSLEWRGKYPALTPAHDMLMTTIASLNNYEDNLGMPRDGLESGVYEWTNENGKTELTVVGTDPFLTTSWLSNAFHVHRQDTALRHKYLLAVKALLRVHLANRMGIFVDGARVTTQILPDTNPVHLLYR